MRVLAVVVVLCGCGRLHFDPLDDAGGDAPLGDATLATLTQNAYVKASNTDAGDAFGFVALSGDSSTLAVSALYESSAATGINGNQADNSASQSGAVYVFRRAGDTWVQEAYVKAFNTGSTDSFGVSLALSGDGATLVVGAELEASAETGTNATGADNSAGGAGAAYVFTRAGATWSQQAYLKASNTGAADQFGRSVAVSEDGTTIAVGAPLESSSARSINGDQADNSAMFAGAVYVFTRAGTVWTQQAYVKASNTDANDNFGMSVALSADGNLLAAGAPGEAGNGTSPDDNSVIGSGAAYVFARAAGVWTQQVYLKAPHPGPDDQFAFALALAGDGSTLAAGAGGESSAAVGVDGDDTNDLASRSGAVFVFAHGSTWQPAAYLKPSNTQAGAQFGVSVSVSHDGATLVAGSFGEGGRSRGIDGDESAGAPVSGAAYLFQRHPGWRQVHYLKASNADAGDEAGQYVAVSADAATLAMSANAEASAATGIDGNQADNSAMTAGAAYTFR